MAPLRLTVMLLFFGSVQIVSGLWYIADETTNRVLELYSAPITTASTPVKLNGNLVTDGVCSWLSNLVPDSMRVVYLADETTDE